MAFPTLADHLPTLGILQKRRKFLVLSELIYKPTGEKIKEAFRYFDCDVQQLVAAAESGDFSALAKLPYAVDREGERDTSSVLVDLAYTSSGSFVAVQAVQYQNGFPEPVCAAVVLEGQAGQAVIAHALELGE